MDKLIGMFKDPADEMTRDMNAIGALIDPGGQEVLAPLTAAEFNEMTTLVTVSGRDGFTDAMRTKMNQLIKRYVANGGADPRTILPTDGDGNPTKPGSMLDLSSPENTITKAVFLMGLSSMFHGPQFFILNGLCIAAIIFSLTNIIKR